jgi:hypothetical protein
MNERDLMYVAGSQSVGSEKSQSDHRSIYIADLPGSRELLPFSPRGRLALAAMIESSSSSDLHNSMLLLLF